METETRERTERVLMASHARKDLELAILSTERVFGTTWTMAWIYGVASTFFLPLQYMSQTIFHREFKSAVTIINTIAWGNGFNR